MTPYVVSKIDYRYENINMENYSIANLGEVVLSLSDDRSSFFYLKDIGLDVAIGSRDQLTTLDETWNNAGIYILPLVYAGKAPLIRSVLRGGNHF